MAKEFRHGDRNKRRRVILLSGEGGHLAQANRFGASLEARGIEVVMLSESNSWLLPPISRRSKEGKRAYWLAAMLAVLWFPACLVYSLVSPTVRGAALVVSFGPMTAMPMALAAQILGRRMVFIESWSRFASVSLTGRIHRRFGAAFLVQNPMDLDGETPDYLGRLG
jgi:hypothetical protein